MKTLTYFALAITLWILPFEKVLAQYIGQQSFSSSEIVYSGDTDPPFRSILTPLGGSSFKEHRVVQYYLFFLNDSPFISILIV